MDHSEAIEDHAQELMKMCRIFEQTARILAFPLAQIKEKHLLVPTHIDQSIGPLDFSQGGIILEIEQLFCKTIAIFKNFCTFL